MAIYRGNGGAGDSTTDATVSDVTEQAVIASTKASEAAASATSAATSASQAASSATSAANSAANAATAAASVTTDAAAAEAAKLAAEASWVAAVMAEAGAETAETNAETAETNAASSASAASTSATNAANSASSAATSASNASTSASAASTSASSAATSATSAASSAGTATTQATAAASSATAAASSATSASSSASAASSSATDAETAQTAAEAAQAAAEAAEAGVASDAAAAAASASAAATSESNAADSESAAATSASNASTSESNAATSASNAATSETNAASSASSASTSASNATTSASNAASSETAASASETAAASSATSASTSASNAATSATSASNSASAASTSASNASTSASNAATSASNASTSESNAASSATAAAGSATSAASSASAASASADAALSALDNFDDRYLGQKATAPTVDNDGDALITGALYFDTTDDAMKVWDGSQWLNAYASLSGALIANNNLSDLNNVATARTNLGLGTAATTNSTAYATAAQGALADSAIQPSDNISELTNDSGYITGNQTITLSGDVSGSGTTSITVTVADDSHNHIIANVDGLQTALDGKLALTGGTLTGDLAFGDNDKAIFGAGSDLQIYHDGSNSYIRENGTGSLRIQGADLEISNPSEIKWLKGYNNNRVELFYNNSIKLSTTSTGIDVTGTVTAGGLIVNGGTTVGSIASNGSLLQVSSASTGGLFLADNGTNLVGFVNGENALRPAGDAYVDLGKSDRRFQDLYLSDGLRGDTLTFSNLAGTERMRIDSSGNVLVGTTTVQGSGGVSLASAGYVYSSRPSSVAIYGDRTGSDGAIQEFRKDGTTVGSISVGSNQLIIDASASNLVLQNSTRTISFSSSAFAGSGSANDAVIDLGSSTRRFRNLYLSGNITASGGTLTGSVTFGAALNETVYSLTGTALDPDNGTIQTKTLSANTTLTDSLTAGQSMTLMIDDGSAYTITWPTITWLVSGGSAPTLETTGYTAIVLWKVGSTLYGKY